jgi:hypothetical protein
MYSRYSAPLYALLVGSIFSISDATPQSTDPVPSDPIRYGIGPTEEDRNVEPHSDINFGAAVGIYGKTAVASMPGIDRVAVHEFRDGTWVRTQTILPSIDFGNVGTFGTTLDLDQDSVVIGGIRQPDVTPISSLHVYRRSRHEWRELVHTELASQQYQFVGDVQQHGNVVVTGVARVDVAPSVEPGSVYVYRIERVRKREESTTYTDHGKRRDKFTMRRSAVIQAGDAIATDAFGSSLALEWPLLVVGAPGVDAAYVFLHVGNTWMQIAKLTSTAGTGIGFGTSVDIRKGVILVGAPGFDFPSEEPSIPEGNAYVFMPTSNGWMQSQELNSGERRFSALFGSEVALGDGVLAISAPIDEAITRAEGHVVAFEWNGEEFTAGRTISEIEGRAGLDLDFSGRWLIAGMAEASAFVERVAGFADIFKFPHRRSAASNERSEVQGANPDE